MVESRVQQPGISLSFSLCFSLSLLSLTFYCRCGLFFRSSRCNYWQNTIGVVGIAIAKTSVAMKDRVCQRVRNHRCFYFSRSFHYLDSGNMSHSTNTVEELRVCLRIYSSKKTVLTPKVSWL